MSTVRVQPFAQWITYLIFCAITSIISLWILVSECRKRRKRSTKSRTKWLKVFSLSCMSFCLASQVSFILQCFPAFCLIFPYIGWIFLILTVWTLGLYQLSRLYYCFAESNNGYPKWVFMVMIIIGTITSMILISTMPIINEFVILSKCGYNDEYGLQLVSYPINISNASSIAWDLFLVSAIMSVAWDLLTLVLYILKIRSLIHNSIEFDLNQNISKRILFTLRKIIILTLLYQIVGVLSILIFSIFGWIIDFNLIQHINAVLFTSLMPVLLSLSMYLMMEHNQTHFVKLIKFFRLHWICCKWRMIVIDQLNAMETNTTSYHYIRMTDQMNNAQIRMKTMETHTKTEIAMSQVIAKWLSLTSLTDQMLYFFLIYARLND